MYVRMHACLHMDICMGPRGFGDLGRRAIYYQRALVIIFRELGSKLMVLGIKGALQKVKK